MNFKIIVNSVILASLVLGGASQADSASGLPTGKRQHKPVAIVKPLDKATPVSMQAAAGGMQADSRQGSRAGYRLCPDGTMINPGEKCPEKSTRSR